ncbi:MAG: hypothetical protein M3296_06085 [Actinomycetota bacterium]|nr:hypothetical protein [Actinomycetota bacterium]
MELDEVAQKRLSEISAAEFLQVLDRMEAGGQPTPPEEATVGDVLSGAWAARRLSAGGLPEKKKVEREKWPVEKFAPEKPPEHFPEKKKVELEKHPMEGFPEKKKVELEKPPGEGFPEKKKVELEKPEIEKQSIENPPDILTNMRDMGDRLSRIEEALSKLSK